MAGNKAAFDAAMARAQSYSFENAWDKALREFQRALEEFPDDPAARTNHAQALYRLKQWPAALEAYSRLLQTRPSDPFVLGRVAECQVQLGQRAAAEQTYWQVAQVFAGSNQVREALAALRAIVALNPAHRPAHERLAEFYKGMGERGMATREHLTLSRLALETPPGHLDEAVKQAELAFGLEPTNAEARDWLYGLRRRQSETTGTIFDERTLRVTGSASRAAVRDLEQMYDLAVQYQERGQFAAARVQFEAARAAGLDTPALHYNLGLLYQQAKETARAAEEFQRAIGDPEHAMSAQYSLGECYRDLGRTAEATRAFEEALSLVDLQQVSKAEVPDLLELFRAAATANEVEDNIPRAASIYNTLATFLQERHWQTGYTAELVDRAKSLNAQGITARLQGIGGIGATPAAPAAKPRITDVLVPPGPVEGASVPQAAVAGLNSGVRSGMLRPITDFLRDVQPAAVDPPGPSAADTPLRPGPRAATSPLDTAGYPTAVPVAPVASNGTGPDELRAAAWAVAGQPQDAEARELVGAADALLAQHLWFAAADCCYEVIRLEPDYLPIHLRLVEVHRGRGQDADAIVKLQAVIDTYMVRGDLHTAARIFPELVAIEPGNVNVRTKLATLLLDIGEHDAAVAEYLGLAEMFYISGERDRALEELRRLRSVAPQNPEVRVQTGLYLLRADRPADALPEFSRALQMDPEHKLALARVFVSLVLMGNDSAWDVLDTMLRAGSDFGARNAMVTDLRSFALTSDRAELFYALALLNDLPVPPGAVPEAERPEVEKRQLKAQVDALEDGLALLSPEDRNYLALLLRFRRAHLAVAQRDESRALQVLAEALDMLDAGPIDPSPRPHLAFLHVPTQLDLYQPLAQVYALQGDTAKAIECLQAAKTHAPYDRNIYTQLAELYFQQGQLGAALVALDELITHYQDSGQIEMVIDTLGYMAKLAPNNITVRQKLADSYLKIGYIELALGELEVLAELQRKAGMVKDAVKTFQRGADIYWQMGQFPEAFAIYDRIVRMAPGDVDARQQLIHLYITTGRIADATREQKRIAEIYVQAKRSKDAVAALHELIALAPSDTDSYYALAEVLAEQNEFGQAARLYGRLRRLEPAKEEQLAELQTEMQRKAQEYAGGSRPETAGGR